MKKTVLTMMILFVATAVAAQNVPSRVAVINVQKVLAESQAGKTALQSLETLRQQREQRLQTMEEEIRTLESELSVKQVNTAADKLEELRKQLSDKKITYQRAAQDAQRELTEARDQHLMKLEEKIMPVISEIGKEMGFAAIFNKLESGLVYASDAIDITDIVVRRFNEAAPSN